jgi:hypothetical protein
VLPLVSASQGVGAPWFCPASAPPPPPRAHPLRRSSGVSPGWSAMHTPLVITPLKRGKRALWTFRERRRTATGENKQRLPQLHSCRAYRGRWGHGAKRSMSSDTLRQRHASAARSPAAPAEPPVPSRLGGCAPPKSLLFAYVLWALPLIVPPVGLLGLHHVYLGRDVHAALYMLSFGGFGFGWLRDGVRLSDYVRQASPSVEERELERKRRELYPRPGGLVRLIAAGYFASTFSLVLRSVWPAPEESPLPQADAWAEVALGGLGIAVGVWAVGSVTPQACDPL